MVGGDAVKCVCFPPGYKLSTTIRNVAELCTAKAESGIRIVVKSRFDVLCRYAYSRAQLDAGEAIVFTYSHSGWPSPTKRSDSIRSVGEPSASVDYYEVIIILVRVHTCIAICGSFLNHCPVYSPLAVRRAGVWRND